MFQRIPVAFRINLTYLPQIYTIGPLLCLALTPHVNWHPPPAITECSVFPMTPCSLQPQDLCAHSPWNTASFVCLSHSPSSFSSCERSDFSFRRCFSAQGGSSLVVKGRSHGVVLFWVHFLSQIVTRRVTLGPLLHLSVPKFSYL